jgi:streptomycin 6-kinase
VTFAGSLAHLCEFDGGSDWLESLPDLVDRCVERWELTLETPYSDGHVALVIPASTPPGERVVLKVQFPHRESETEALALHAWDGAGAVRLIDEAPDHHALLLERCEPGDHLATRDGEYAIGVIIDILPRLWVPAVAGIGSLAAEASRWVSSLPVTWEQAGRPFEQRLLDAAIETLTSLAVSSDEYVILNQDLHGDNILAARREPWLAIDPKPLTGEREFGLSPVIRAYELGHSRRDVLYRLDRLTGDLGLDRERARLWAFGQAIAWGFEAGKALPNHIDTARWLLEAG